MACDHVIAIDGPAASGKSTAARNLAARLGLPYINTGNMYRAITLAAMRRGILSPDACTEENLRPVLEDLSLEYVRDNQGKWVLVLDGKVEESALRMPEVAAMASPVAAVPVVRNFLLDKQRNMAQLGWIVMEGRDIGSVIFPGAKYKFFLTASPMERARRRLAQSGESSSADTLESVAAAIAERDRLDSTRPVAPLRPAEDAVIIDSSDLTQEQVLDFLAEKVSEDVS